MDELIPLRNNGILVKPSKWPPTADNDPPRTLKALARIVDGNLCHRCGSCVGICPTSVLSLDEEEYPVVRNLSSCTDCELCVKVCPGVSFDSPTITKKVYGYLPDSSDIHGHFDEAYLSYAMDSNVRQISSSGGLITALLVSLLELNEIDGALVVTSDEETLWKGRPILARTKEEIISASKSKYAISPTNVGLEEIRKTPGRYAVVGLPCQIHGIMKAIDLDSRLRERIILTIGLFCHAAIEHEPMRIIWQTLGQEGRNARRFLSRVGKHPGTPYIELNNGQLKPVYFQWLEKLKLFPFLKNLKLYRPSSTEMLNVFYRLYTPMRCFSCYDATAEFADIAVGDPWMAPPSPEIKFTDGYSFVLARTPRALEALKKAADADAIHLYKLRREEAKGANSIMGREKRWRAFRIIETLHRQGRPAPEYNMALPKPSFKHLILTEINLITHILCFVCKFRSIFLRIALSPVGYLVLWLNFQKRCFRDWRRDKRAERKRTKDDLKNPML